MLLNLTQYSSQTLQEQIIGQIRAQILSGDLEPDQPLTSIRALSQQLRVGVNTVQRAYENLLREELVYARPGKGFFVSPLKKSDKSDLATQRFEHALEKIIHEARSEGLSEKDIKRSFTKLQSGVINGDA